MKKSILFVCLLLCYLLSPSFAQTIKHSWGMNASGTSYKTGVVLSTSAGSPTVILFDLSNYFPFDLFAGHSDTTLFLGTFTVAFDNYGTASPTTDSVLYTIKAYPAVSKRTTEPTNLIYGTAVTLETIRVAGDYFTTQKVYVIAAKNFPPEVIKIEIGAINDADIDDSTRVYWNLSYPGQ